MAPYRMLWDIISHPRSKCMYQELTENYWNNSGWNARYDGITAVSFRNKICTMHMTEIRYQIACSILPLSNWTDDKESKDICRDICTYKSLLMDADVMMWMRMAAKLCQTHRNGNVVMLTLFSFTPKLIYQIDSDDNFSNMTSFLFQCTRVSRFQTFGIPHFVMMTPSNRNIFRVTSPLCGEFGHRWIPRTKASDAEL